MDGFVFVLDSDTPVVNSRTVWLILYDFLIGFRDVQVAGTILFLAVSLWVFLERRTNALTSMD